MRNPECGQRGLTLITVTRRPARGNQRAQLMRKPAPTTHGPAAPIGGAGVGRDLSDSCGQSFPGGGFRCVFGTVEPGKAEGNKLQPTSLTRKRRLQRLEPLTQSLVAARCLAQSCVLRLRVRLVNCYPLRNQASCRTPYRPDVGFQPPNGDERGPCSPPS